MGPKKGEKTMKFSGMCGGKLSVCVQHIIYSHILSYITALQLEVVFNFISAVIIRHLPFLCVRGQIGRQALPLDKEEAEEDTNPRLECPHSLHL